MANNTEDLPAALTGVAPPILVVMVEGDRVIDVRYAARGTIKAALLAARMGARPDADEETRKWQDETDGWGR